MIDFNASPVIQWPLGNISVKGADNGLTFPLYLNKTAPQQMFDPSLNRPIDIMFQGAAVAAWPPHPPYRRPAPGCITSFVYHNSV